MTVFAEKELWKRQDALSGVALIVGGLIVNYILEHRTFLKPGVLSPRQYLGAWPDIYLPSVAFFLLVSGLTLVAFSVKRHVLPAKAQWRFWPAFLITIPLTILYCLFYVGMQFIATGADRLGECSGLDQAASASNAIPSSRAFPGNAAVGCSVERYGLFLSFYNDLTVYGVADPPSQARVIQSLRDYRTRTHTHPLHVAFYEQENWSPLRVDSSGKPWGGQRGPETLLRVVTVR